MIFQKKWIVIFVVLCLGACSVNLVPSKDAWYAQHYIIMQEFEWESYKSLSDAGKLQFQELFWTVRDPSAKATFMARLDFANENFRKEKSSQPWNTDRGRIYLLNGRPAEVRYVENDNLGGIGIIPAGGDAMDRTNVDRSREDIGARMSEIWVYSSQSSLITYQFDFKQPKQWKLNPNVSNSSFLQELEQTSRNVTYRILDVEKYKAQLEELKKII